MARQKSEIKKIKPNFLDFLKTLSKYLTNKNRNTDNLLKQIERYDVEKSFLFNRTFSYLYTKPHLIWYINKYLNNKYEFYNYDIAEYMDNISYIIDQNNVKRLFFLKAKDLKDTNKTKIKKIFKDYYLIIKRKYINDDELNYLYSLFCQKIITVDEIEKINQIINGSEAKLNLDLDILESYTNQNTQEDQNNKLSEYLEYMKTRTLPEKIQTFCQELKERKQNRKDCHQCKLFDRQMVVLDTNREDIGPVDLMFVALNPGSDEAVFNRPLVGRSGKLIREKVFNINSNITWLMTNVLLCQTNNQKDIGKNDKQIMQVCNNCKEFIHKIIENFPAKVYIPLGKQAIEFFGIKGSVTQNSGKYSKNDNGSIVVPLIHPSAVLQSRNQNTPIFNSSWDVIFQISNKLAQKKKSQTVDVKENIHKEIQTKRIPMAINTKYKVPPEKMINFVDESLTYFDSVNIDNENVLNVYIDEDGEKKYKIETFNIPIYIKDCKVSERNMLNSDFEYVTYINGNTRYRLAKTLKDNLITQKYKALQPKGM